MHFNIDQEINELARQRFSVAETTLVKLRDDDRSDHRLWWGLFIRNCANAPWSMVARRRQKQELLDELRNPNRVWPAA